jgi:DNA polymerase-4/DNA polymerase V
MSHPVSVRTWPKSILHIDGDSFFAACEQARDPELAGEPIVVGKERGIATAISKEAKQEGVTRGMQMQEVKEVCPNIRIVESDYEYYKMLAGRMFAIVRDYTPDVEEYSIDECFAEITGLRSVHNASYEKIAQDIKENLKGDIGVTFSVGVAPTKTTAKVASADAKPAGCTCIPARAIHYYLRDLPVEDIWGIGKRTAHRLHTHGIETALGFAHQDKSWIQTHLAKPYQQIWHELRGKSCKTIKTTSKKPQSITRSKTFSPSTTDKKELLGRIASHAEAVCKKARNARMYTDTISFFLKDQQFRTAGRKLTLSAKTNSPKECMRVIRTAFSHVYNPHREYRTTGVRMLHLIPYEKMQRDLFSTHIHTKEERKIFETIDEINDTLNGKKVRLARTLYKSQHYEKDDTKQVEKIQLPHLGRVR